MLQKTDALQIARFLLVFFVLAPFSGFAFNLPNVTLWQAHGYFCLLGITLAFGFQFFEKNRPFGFLIMWFGLMTWWRVLTSHIMNSGFSVQMFTSYFVFLYGIIWYWVLVKNKAFFDLVRQYYWKVVFGLAIYGVLQRLNIDQFYKPLQWWMKDEVVGVLGNPMHYAHYLAITLPLVLHRKLLAVFVLFMVWVTGSLSGLAIGIATVLFYYWFKGKIRWWWIGIALLAGIGIGYWQWDYINGFIHSYPFDNGRFAMWAKWFEFFKQRPITGWGLGIINGISAKVPEFYGWRHVHNEFYQVAIETGLVGLTIVIWAVIDYFKRFAGRKDENTLVYGSMFFAFLLCSAIGFPAHLWILATLGILSYSYMYLEDSNDSNQKRDTGQCCDHGP